MFYGFLGVDSSSLSTLLSI